MVEEISNEDWADRVSSEKSANPDFSQCCRYEVMSPIKEGRNEFAHVHKVTMR
jgi:hypothetical protein